MGGSVLVVSGPPGAGKSTVARLLAGGREQAVHLHTDDFYAWIVRGYVAPWLPAAQDQNVVVMEAIAGVAGRFAQGGYDVMVDGIVGPWFLEPWRALAAEAARTVAYVVLRPDVAVAEHRAAHRGEHPLDDLSVVPLMHAAFADLGPFEGHAVDSSGATADQTAALVRRRLEAGELDLRPS